MIQTVFTFALYIATMVAFGVSTTPPRPPPTSAELVSGKTSMKFLHTTFKPVLSFFVYGSYALELFQRNAPLFQPYLSPALDYVCSPQDQTRISSSMSLHTIIGLSLTTLGGIGRLACYRALGKMFTFEISLVKDHTLVTSGPYRIVRHPSYTMLLVGMIGYAFFLTSYDGVYVTCIEPHHPRLYYGYVSTYIFFNGLTSLAFMKRTWEEDELLHREFGEQWERWAKVVRYRLIPYVY
ncbi:hypothetical protein DL96DRAFT_1704839 [Flagelloscypha sp. PMI_526]|nr:hypothetical protein DL96DRAFT_1704839 [Flagelloscypha sp. PMI_526]